MYRSLLFSRLLPRYGWDVRVLTIHPEALRFPGLLDGAPLADLPGGVKVERTPVYEPFQAVVELRNRIFGAPRRNGANGDRLAVESPGRVTWRDWVSDCFSLPDRQSGQILPSAKRAIELIESGEIDAIYSSSPPASSHVAALLAKRATSLPWVADFRDPWISNRFVPVRQTTFLDRVDSWLERVVVHNADRVIANTDELRDDFRRRYADLSERFLTVTNGFDPDESPPGVRPLRGERRRRPFRITHAGTLYGNRSGAPVVRALEILHERGVIEKGDVELCLLGAVEGEDEKSCCLGKDGAGGMVRFIETVPRREAIRFLADSDLLLLIQSGTTLQVPRKLFEYVALRRPVMALVTPGATENLIRREKLGVIVRPDDPEGIARVLHKAIRGEALPVPERPARFDFVRLTGELARCLGELV